MSTTRLVKFVGGPLDGQQKQIGEKERLYKHEQPPLSDDIRIGEIPVAFFPPFHEYVYEQSIEDNTKFLYKAEHHQ